MSAPLAPGDSEFGHMYAPEAGCIDEMWAQDGRLRPHWEYFTTALRALGADELERRRQEGARLLRENGVTYNVYGDPAGLARPWELDPIPLLVGSEEWADIESGLIQRAELLNLILDDIYGRRELLRKGLIPAELIFGHPGFLRPCDQIKLPGEHQLLTYAADLARGPDGRMWVLSDRTQAPSGAGYALENRMAMTHILPSVFRDCHVHRLALFFRALRAQLAAVAPHKQDEPNIVVLTPGPRNETYFEHAYLAAYLGYTLVQGADLTVRNEQVWLKSLGGLRRVDVILRRVDDHFCDPMELREDSQLGVPGLLQAARQGNVSIVNPLGSSVLENPALLAFLPRICKHFLGQNLRMPSVATWWCGYPDELHYVLANMDKLVIKPVCCDSASRSVFVERLSEKEKGNLKARIKAQPHLFVGQESVSISTTPSLAGNSLEPRHAVLRSFLVARDGDYKVMPGGLTRAAPSRGTFVVSNQAGGISKDTWVLASEPEKQVSLWQHAAGEPAIAAEQGGLPSRALDNLYWVGRYAERAEATARLLRTVLRKYEESREFGDAAGVNCLHILLRALTHLTATYPGFVQAGSDKRLEQPKDELLDLIFNKNRVGGLVPTLQSMVQAAYAVRDLWSADAWRVVDAMEDAWVLAAGPAEADFGQLQNRLDRLIVSLAAFSGLTRQSMSREDGWVFLEIGQCLERGLLISSLLRSTLVQKVDEYTEYQLLEAVLVASESLITYRRRYRGYLEPRNVLDLALFDDISPRSLIYQIDRLQKHVETLPHDQRPGRLSEEQKLVLEAASQLRLSDVSSLSENGPAETHGELDQRLGRIVNLLGRASDAITKAYFSHGEEAQQLYPTHGKVDP